MTIHLSPAARAQAAPNKPVWEGRWSPRRKLATIVVLGFAGWGLFWLVAMVVWTVTPHA